ncbi:alpha/beta fold hydrolase [Allomuricauda sp.]|jgi:predicted alpha/beta-fold hydrolase|uniref:YheT family hydrolase n=1 Tax=Flagellimonas sp. TaxID=2058762 RepID=UPI001B162DAC|nr:alpha/beta fold hydrolase [Allomuricauda sp.]MBO6532000.1 alpha/beta fold hydrolase [Allomuricauda sp.]MBO6587828.1 alpha/beta fold hydrolase [Allomuricauda sp.]MBO6617453.1 alpha/beta fold hydrolase [Allomuricauda sp.]MBO6643536.1 alpha/beta fold hydrolase [Allomuricauda sp.]MBO6745788.1 alpha/beta fold hydrolase [Allomuricauda sp.]
MPQLNSDYTPPLLFKNGHFATIYSGIIRSVNGVVQKRERITLSDGDFLDLDWSDSVTPTQKLVILLHGLEGDAQRPYITGSAKILNQNGYDTCAVNYRGCSGEPNVKYRSYHSGATEDLIEVLNHILNTKNYSEIYLKGFSLGGNLLLKYLGEGNDVPKEIKGAVAVSVPCNLHDSCKQLLSIKNIMYAIKFKGNLLGKLRQKQHMFPDKISDNDIKSIKTLKDFDDIYTSQAHGFEDALDYYKKSSSLQFLPHIQVPSLIINAKDDSFLGPECYPIKETDRNNKLFLEMPSYGGHVGFWGKNNITYTEKRALAFFDSI